LDEGHNRVDLSTDRREHRLDLAIGQAAKLGKYVYRRGDMFTADDLGEDAPRLLTDDLCLYPLSGEKSPAFSLATLLVVAVVVIGFCGWSPTVVQRSASFLRVTAAERSAAGSIDMTKSVTSQPATLNSLSRIALTWSKSNTD
jgi:hypothetical protein